MDKHEISAVFVVGVLPGMKRVSGLRRVRIVQHNRAKQRRAARRKSPRLKGTGLPAPLDGPIRHTFSVPRRRSRIAIHLPDTLSLRDNFVKTVSAISLMRQAILVRNWPVMLHFDNVHKIEPAATLMLAAEIERCRKLRPYVGGLIVNGTYPPDTDVFLQLREMGFYKLIGVPDREEVPDNRETSRRPRFLNFFTFDTVESVVAAQLTELVSVGAFAISEKLKGRMTGAVKEAMGNAVEHAYMTPGYYPTLDGRWWCAAYVDPMMGEMMIILYDQGVGVSGTLDADLFDLIRSIVTTRSWRLSDGYMIAAATELYRTSTGQSGRGRGFRDMKKFVDSCDDGELRVLSNSGSYRYMKGGEQISDESLSIGGTLVEWRVRHGQPVDFEDA